MYFKVNGIKTFCSNGSGVLRADQPTVIFIHGAGLDHTIFALPARYFARHNYNVYALDLPGHGRSAGSPLMSITEMATWTKDAMDQLEILHPAIVGYSMGSLVALQFAVSFPTLSVPSRGDFSGGRTGNLTKNCLGQFSAARTFAYRLNWFST